MTTKEEKWKKGRKKERKERKKEEIIQVISIRAGIITFSSVNTTFSLQKKHVRKESNIFGDRKSMDVGQQNSLRVLLY